ncbi:MAG: energy transducer TonB [Lacunisphaera sp.]
MPEERYLPVPMKTEPAHSLGGGLDAEYPAELDDLRLPGVVRIQFTVEADGTARQLHVIFASHPAFVESALRTLEQAKFAPAHQGPLARSATLEYPVEFGSVGAKPADIFAANHLELLTEGASIPRPFLLIQPVYPHDRLLAGEGRQGGRRVHGEHRGTERGHRFHRFGRRRVGSGDARRHRVVGLRARAGRSGGDGPRARHARVRATHVGRRGAARGKIASGRRGCRRAGRARPALAAAVARVPRFIPRACSTCIRTATRSWSL